MDDLVDKTYGDHVSKAAHSENSTLKCTVAGTLILHYLESIADQATYVRDSVLYIVSGKNSSEISGKFSTYSKRVFKIRNLSSSSSP